MDRRARRAAAACMLAALVLAAGPGTAQPPPERDTTLELDRRGAEGVVRPVQDGPISLDEAVERARERFDGRVVRAETRTIEGREVHVIRILDSNGRVRNVQFDAATGRIRR